MSLWNASSGQVFALGLSAFAAVVQPALIAVAPLFAKGPSHNAARQTMTRVLPAIAGVGCVAASVASIAALAASREGHRTVALVALLLAAVSVGTNLAGLFFAYIFAAGRP